MVRRPNYRMERADRSRKQAERAAKKAAARAAKSKPRDDGTDENPAEVAADATQLGDE
jgi:hypothetical protein